MSFAAAIARPQIVVAEAVAELARDVYPEADVTALLERLHDLAAPLAGRGLAGQPLEAQATALGGLLHGSLGFRGNAADYDDPRNSLLPDVLARRTGLPIALSLVYVETARALGLRAAGVGFPGHFIMRLDGPEIASDAPVFLDPFAGGEIIAHDELARRFQRATRVSSPAALEAHLAPIQARPFLSRWLGNLRGAYLRRGELARALVVLDRLLELRPDDVSSLRERGLVAYKLGAAAAARNDLERVAALDREGPLGKEAAAVLAQISIRTSSLN